MAAFLGMALAPFRPTLTRSASSDSVMSAGTGDASHARLSDSSTPPTSAADSDSVSFPGAKLGIADNVMAEGEAGSDSETEARDEQSPVNNARLRRPRKFRQSEVRQTQISTRRRIVSRDSLVTASVSNDESSREAVEKGAESPVRSGFELLDRKLFSKKPSKPRGQSGPEGGDRSRKGKFAGKDNGRSNRRATRSAGEPVESFTKQLSVLGKRGRDKFEAGLVKAKRELKRLADTNEFAKIDTKPVLAEVWSNGKLVTGEEPPKKRVKFEAKAVVKTEEEIPHVEMMPKKRGPKIWLNKGLYAGQQGKNLDWFSGVTKEEKKKMVNMPEYKPNGLLPLPMWHGQRLLHAGRNFKLPFDVCSPLPPGQPKPDEWRKVPKNRFVGDAAAAWKKSTVFDDFSSRCVCSAINSCDESCQNRIMLYECDDGNCSAGREHCTNRAFVDLQERRSKGGKYRIGVEVIKTADRGYGVRSNRCFNPQQIIVEYTGEIITEEECDRRMNEDYKDNECYYLMLFDQNMIIDATRGSIARFVNHSCEPNCRMVKWIVAGKPRMALFAGDRPITTGEELTYDYNFDPFSAKNVQECRCGSENCRGVLGPKPKDKPKASATLGESLKQAFGARKRKLKDMLAGEKDIQKSPKKYKTNNRTKASKPVKPLKVVKGLKYTVSSASSTTTKGRKSVIIEQESTKSTTVQKYGSGKDRTKKQTYLSASKKIRRTLIADGLKGKSIRKEKPIKKESDSERTTLTIVRGVRKRKLSTKGQELHRSKSKNSLVVETE